MVIECPACHSRYRTRVVGARQSPIQVRCPKCSHQFLVDPARDHSESSLGKPNILVVDDALFFRDLLVDLLKGSEANLLTAESAEDAWIKLHQQKIDLMLVDINLPDKNGLELIRDMRADSNFAKTKVLCISGVHRKEDDAKIALRVGADDFISKSFKPEDLLDRINNLLKK